MAQAPQVEIKRVAGELTGIHGFIDTKGFNDYL
jgi:hypothetical protein